MFLKPLLIALDMDGTLCLTAKYLRDYAIQQLTIQGRQADLDWIAANPTMSTLLWPEHLRNMTDIAVVEGFFMLDVEPSAIVQAGLFDRLRKLRAQVPEIKVVICTHRGFHKQGEIYTDTWLGEHDGLDVIDELHAIDPKDHPNKLTFLSELYPEYNIRLLDDNPLFRTEEPHDQDSRLMVYEEEGTIPAYQYQFKVNDIRDFILGLTKVGVLA